MPTARIAIPMPLQPSADGRRHLTIEGETVAEVLECLLSEYRDLRPLLLDSTGSVRRHVNVYVDRKQVSDPMCAHAPLESDCEIRIIPSIAGG
jgi:molybdopterin converting factor small subunit